MLQHTARLRGSHVSSGKSRLGTAQPLPKGERLSERSHRLLLYRHFTNYCPHQDGWGNYLITSINRFAPSFRRVSVTENPDRKSTRLNSSHANISYAVFCLK